MTNKFRDIEEVHADYLAEHPEDIDGLLSAVFADYAQDGDNAVLLTQLRTIARAKGITEMAEQIGMTRQGLQKALSAKGNPRLGNINGIMKAMGYHLTPQRLEQR